MIEKLPTPYGLVRQGVAPDHQEVKSVMTTFTEVASNSRYRFFGNVLVDEDNSKENTVSIHEMKEAYDIVVLAYGASSDKSLDMDGEHLKGVLSARNFVNWYNSHPDYTHIGNEFDLSKTKKVAIIGQGNVALDCARILMKSIEELEQTDISLNALYQLKRSAVDEVIIIGRRGHIQASFTIKEIRELTKLTNVNVNILQSEIDAGLTESSKNELSNNRSKARIIELLNKIAVQTTERVNSEVDIRVEDRNINLRFLFSPVHILSRDDDPDRVAGIMIEKNELIGDENKQKAIAVEGTREVIKCDLILKSVGYKSDELKGIPFDHNRNIIPNLRGRVIHVNLEINESPSNDYLAGVYVTGWLKRGPSGIIGTNITDAKETVECILEDINNMKHFKSDINYDNENYDNSKYDPVDMIKGMFLVMNISF
jgi:adrenodoxin-NADP+ reductase